MKPTLMMAAGGTAGHLFPAITCARFLKSQGYEVIFAAHGLENNPHFPFEEFLAYDIASSSVVRSKNPWVHIKTGCLWLKGFIQSVKRIKKHKPQLIIGFGSFHTFPVILAALFLRKKLWLNEQNVALGKVNQLLAPFAQKIVSHYPLHPKHHNYQAVSMPLRFSLEQKASTLKAREKLQLNPHLTTLLVFGGSQGALAVNEWVIKAFNLLPNRNFQVIHLAGHRDNLEALKRKYDELSILAYVNSFEPQMNQFYQASDFVICRSGASSIAELIEFELPALMIPYPFARAHQEKNADYFQQYVQGGSKLLQNQLTPELLARYIQMFLNPSNRQAFMEKIRSYKREIHLSTLHSLVLKEFNS